MCFVSWIWSFHWLLCCICLSIKLILIKYFVLLWFWCGGLILDSTHPFQWNDPRLCFWLHYAILAQLVIWSMRDFYFHENLCVFLVKVMIMEKLCCSWVSMWICRIEGKVMESGFLLWTDCLQLFKHSWHKKCSTFWLNLL